MNITLTKAELVDLLNQAADAAVQKYLAVNDPKNDLISQRTAYDMYGIRRVNLWRERGLIDNRGRVGGGKNCKILYSKTQLAQAEYADRVKGASFMR